jgi:peptidoglycan/LPS O-acetylase OafA/YrhL
MAIFGTFGRADALLAGGALALANWRFPRWAVPAGLALLLAVFALQPDDAAMARYGLTFASLAGILLVGSLADASPARFSPFSHRAPRAIGRVSYGLYLWDYPLVLFLGPVLGSLATFSAAALSYRFVELPFLRLKDRPLHVLPARGASPPFCQQLAVSETQQPISTAPSPISQLLKNNGQRNRLKQVGIGSAEPRTPLSISVTSTSWQIALRRRSSDAPTRFDS